MTDDTTQTAILAAYEEFKAALADQSAAEAMRHAANIAMYKADDRAKRALGAIERLARGESSPPELTQEGEAHV